MGWSKLAAAIGEFGFPVIMAMGMGYFIWYVWKVITIDIKPALGKLFASSIKLTDQLRMLDQDMIRLQQKINVVLEYREREKLLEFHEAVSGARFHAAYFRPGGVHQDFPEGLEDKIYKHIEKFPKFIDDLETLLTENRVLKQRSVDIGIMTSEDAILLGCSGTVLRASGLA